MKKRFLLIGLAMVVVAVFPFLFMRMAASRTAAQITSSFPGNSQTIFEKSERFTLYRLDGSEPALPAPEGDEPDQYEEKNKREEKDDTELFHDYPVIFKTQLNDPPTRQRIIDAYYKGLAFNGEPAACFQPHHGIRAEKNGETVDLLICFGCLQGWAYSEGQKVSFLVGREPQAVFDEILTRAELLGKAGS